VTGDSDPSGTSYAPKVNPSESAFTMAPDFTKVEGFFTPSDPNYGMKVLDQIDSDFGSGGVLLLPDQPGSSTRLAVAAGKAGLCICSMPTTSSYVRWISGSPARGLGR
jgi:hypothetical protein